MVKSVEIDPYFNPLDKSKKGEENSFRGAVIHNETRENVMELRPVVQVQLKTVYGNTLVYPANESAETFAALAKTKTLSHADLCKIESLGFRIEQTHAEWVR